MYQARHRQERGSREGDRSRGNIRRRLESACKGVRNCNHTEVERGVRSAEGWKGGCRLPVREKIVWGWLVSKDEPQLNHCCASDEVCTRFWSFCYFRNGGDYIPRTSTAGRGGGGYEVTSQKRVRIKRHRDILRQEAAKIRRHAAHLGGTRTSAFLPAIVLSAAVSFCRMSIA